MSTGPKETVYDAEIAPLMTRIIEACQRAGIAMVARYELDEDAAGDPMCCTTVLPGADSSDEMLDLARRMQPRRLMSLAITSELTQDGGTRTTVRSIP